MWATVERQRLFASSLHFFASARKKGADAVFRQTDVGTDIAVGFAFQMEHANGGCFGGCQLFQRAFDVFQVVLIVVIRFAIDGVLVERFEGGLVPKKAELGHASHDDSSRNDSKVSCERALATESAKNREILVNPCHEDICNQIVAKVLGQ